MYKYRTFSIVYNIFSFPVCQRTYIVILETKVPPRRPRAAGGTKRLVVDIKLTPINYNTTELSLNQVQL